MSLPISKTSSLKPFVASSLNPKRSCTIPISFATFSPSLHQICNTIGTLNVVSSLPKPKPLVILRLKPLCKVTVSVVSSTFALLLHAKSTVTNQQRPSPRMKQFLIDYPNSSPLTMRSCATTNGLPSQPIPFPSTTLLATYVLLELRC